MHNALKEIPFLEGLTEHELESVRLCIREKTYEKGEHLFCEGDLCERIFVIRSGRVKVSRASSTGREQTLDTLGAGHLCACHPGIPGWTCMATGAALTPVRVWYLSKADYARLLKTSPKLSEALNKLFAYRLRNLSSLIEEISLKDVKKRLVKFLLDELKERHPHSNGLKVVLAFPYTREEVAQRIGTARETVVRTLYQLKDFGFIDIKPSQLIVRNQKALEALLE